MIPLAERMRPQTLDTYVGQQHLVGEGAVLRQAVGQAAAPGVAAVAGRRLAARLSAGCPVVCPPELAPGAVPPVAGPA